MKDDDIISLFDRVDFNSGRSHIITTCPFCDKPNHLYIQTQTVKTDRFNKNMSWNFQCKKCNENGRVFKLLKQLGALHLIEIKSPSEKSFTLNKIDFQKRDSFAFVEPDEVASPYGSNEIEFHSYLDGRRFTQFHYNQFRVSETELSLLHKDRLIFHIANQNRTVGWISRTTYTSQQIDAINEQNGGKKYTRYINSKGADFSRVVVGLDELNSETHTVIVVEGLFDKVSVDSALNLQASDEVKCVAVNTKSISIDQQWLIKTYAPNVDQLIIWFDPDAHKDSLAHANKFYFDFKKVGILYDSENDPGSLSIQDIRSIFTSRLKTSINFRTDVLNRRKLK